MEKRKAGSEKRLHYAIAGNGKQAVGWHQYSRLHLAQKMLVGTALLVAALLASQRARAFDMVQLTDSLGYSSVAAKHSGLSVVTDNELGRVWARGLPERLFAGNSVYFANGIAVEASANTARLLTPPPGFGDAGAAFGNIRFNPRDLSTVIANSGAALVRLSTYISDAHMDNMRADGTPGPRVGSVSVHGIDLRGTTIRIERIR